MDRTDEDRAAPPYWVVERLIENAQRRARPEFRRRTQEIDTGEAVFPDEGGEFVSYFIGQEGGLLAAIPFEVTDAMHMEMMEAKRQAGWAALTDYCLRLVPVINAIERYAA